MKKILYIILVILVASCNHLDENNDNNEKKSTSNTDTLTENTDSEIVKIDINFNIDSIVKLNNEWFKYYQSKINGFSPDKFEFKEYWVSEELLYGNIFGDFDKEFNKHHEGLLINSPDNQKYIDIDSYHYNIEKDKNGNLVLTGGEVDQEINIVNRTSKEVKRLEFFGATAQVNDAKWINNNTVVLYGIINDMLIIEIIQISELKYYLFEYPTPIEDEDYNKDIRLGGIRFKS